MSRSHLPPEPPAREPRQTPRQTPEVSPEISPVFQRAGQMGARVRQPDSPWNLALGLAFAVVLGVIVFATLSAGRQARADNPTAKAAAPAPPARPAPQPQPIQLAQTAAPVPAPVTAPAPASSDAAIDEARRLHAPVMVVDLTDPGQAQSQAQATPAKAGAAGPDRAATEDAGGSAEDRFAARVASGGVETSRATRLRDPAWTAPQGTVIPAVLETAINSDLPGSVRAVVSRDVRGFDGTHVLIPRGSKLIGQYRNGVAYGQSRAFVIWSRILTPDGVSVDVGSPGTDPLGRGGLAGETDSHFFQRFGGAILLSVLTAGMEAAANQGGGTSVIIGSPGPAAGLASVAPQSTASMPVTVKVMQGSPLQVFLVRDLDFAGVAAAGPMSR